MPNRHLRVFEIIFIASKQIKKRLNKALFKILQIQLPLSGHAIFFAEFIDTAGRIDHFLFAGIERVAFGADIDMQLLVIGRPGLEGITTAAFNRDFFIYRMYVLFHSSNSCSVIHLQGPWILL